MYPPPHYIDDSQAFITDVIKTHSFAVLTTAGAGGQCATHIPMIFDNELGEYGMLYGHVSAGNPQAGHFNGRSHGMAVFSGPHAYISPTWIKASRKEVPTWNYTAVHAWGRPVAIDAETGKSLMDKLALQYEGDDAWDVSQMNSGYANALMENYIVWFKFEITSVRGIRKMSQNKPAETRQDIISALRDTGETATAIEIEKFNPREPL